MKKLSTALVLLFCTLASPVVLASTWPAASRAVYYGGKRHYISLDDNQRIVHYEADATDLSWLGNPTENGVVDIPKGYKRQVPLADKGQGVALYGSTLLHFSVVTGSGDPYLMMVRYDLNLGKYIEAPVIWAKLDVANEDYGVAAVVASGNVYVFTNSLTLTSGKGGAPGTWTRSGPIRPVDGSTFEPADALAFTPADGGGMQKVMVVFTKPYPGKGSSYVVWDPAVESSFTAFPLAGSRFRSFGVGGGIVYYAAIAQGTTGPPSSGEKAASLQVFLMMWDNYNYKVRRCRYDVVTDSMSLDSAWQVDTGDSPLDRMHVYPWFVDAGLDAQGREVVQQQIHVDYRRCTTSGCLAYSQHEVVFPSDYMVPLNKDPDSGPNNYGWEGIPTNTDISDDPVMWNYWTMLGVIMGPAPFAINGETNAGVLEKLSNVEYGVEASSSIESTSTTTNSVMFGSQTEIKTGVANETIDLSYKHLWEHKHSEKSTTTKSTQFTCGTEGEAGELGLHGCAIFAVPILLVQDFTIYAYDYDLTTTSGTLLDQDLYTVVVVPNSVRLKSLTFRLADGTPIISGYQGLFEGMAPQPDSTDLDAWAEKTWADAKGWQVLCGTTQSCTPAQLVQGTPVHDGLLAAKTTVDSKGSTNAFDVSVGFSFGKEGHLLGFKETLTAGYAGEWSMETTNETEMTENLEIQWSQKDDAGCTTCTTAIEIQPFLLQATEYGAPWVPTNYAGSLPWAITWSVTSHVNPVTGVTRGRSPLPERVLGTIRPRWSTYSVERGSLEWERAGGTVVPIPISARRFDPALGATLKVNGYELRMDRSSGRWTRYGDVWEFRSKASAPRDVVTCRLDFARRTWSFDGSRLGLAEAFPAGRSRGRLELNVNGKHVFVSDVPHRARMRWEVPVDEPDASGFSLTWFEGRYDTGTGEGAFLAEGKVPAGLRSFGDLGFVFHGREVGLPLLQQPDLWETFRDGSDFRFHDGGKRIAIDFGRGSWATRFNDEAFHPEMAPRWGRLHLGIRLGGHSVYDEEKQVLTYETKLTWGE